MLRRLKEIGTVVGSVAVLAFGVFLLGLGCFAIHWFFWSQRTCSQDIGISLVVGSFLVVYGKRTLVMAFDLVSPSARPISRKDAAVVLALAVLIVPIFARPIVGQMVALGRGWIHVSPRSEESSSLKANRDQPSLGYDPSRYGYGTTSSPDATLPASGTGR